MALDAVLIEKSLFDRSRDLTGALKQRGLIAIETEKDHILPEIEKRISESQERQTVPGSA